MSNKIAEYGKEVIPMYKELDKQKELLKAFKETDEVALGICDDIKELQAKLKKRLEEHEDSAEILEKIKDISRDIKTAVAGAANGEKYKPAQLKQYYAARAKEKVDDVIEKGDLFDELQEVMKQP